jgi:hypothetical protein
MSERKSVDRREFLRRAAITGAAAAWAVPAVQTVAATPAFAQTNGTPAVSDHSACVSACNEAGNGCGGGGVCENQCRELCPPGGTCCNPALTQESGWTANCEPQQSSLAGCPGTTGIIQLPL